MKTIVKLTGVFLLVFSVMTGFASPGLSAEPIYVALSAPLTGTYAEYGQNFKKAMTLGIEWINADGGINGRPIELVIGDSKGDPKESAALAQKFTSDKRIVAELGDFTGRHGAALTHFLPSKLCAGQPMEFWHYWDPGGRRAVYGPVRQ